MPGRFDNILATVGRTPVVRLNKLAPPHVNVYAKLEAFNPMGSVKDRLALNVIEDAEKRGTLRTGQTVIEATSGNTGIGLAMVCAQKGYPLVIVMAENFSIERRKMMRYLGAQVILTPAALKGSGTLKLRAIRGALAMVLSARRDGRAFVLPAASAAEAALVRDADRASGARSCSPFARTSPDSTLLPALTAAPPVACAQRPRSRDVRGQAQAKRALEIAAAGRHSLLFVGPPGTGKSMLAQRLPSLLPPLTEDEALESAALASLAGTFAPERWRERPFRAPHHTASAAALVGGGSHPRPGEISLAHHGVLFLDELPEWNRHVLEVLREPIESGVIHISRAARQCAFPAQFQFVAAMNPCPCGWLGDAVGPLPLRARAGRALSRARVRAAARSARPRDRRAVASRRRARVCRRPGRPPNRRRTCASASSRAQVVQRERQGKPNARLTAQEVATHCHAGRGRREAARARDGAAVAIGARVSPHPEGRADDRRPRRQRERRQRACGRGAAVSALRPRGVARPSGARKPPNAISSRRRTARHTRCRARSADSRCRRRARPPAAREPVADQHPGAAADLVAGHAHRRERGHDLPAIAMSSKPAIAISPRHREAATLAFVQRADRERIGRAEHGAHVAAARCEQLRHRARARIDVERRSRRTASDRSCAPGRGAARPRSRAGDRARDRCPAETRRCSRSDRSPARSGSASSSPRRVDVRIADDHVDRRAREVAAFDDRDARRACSMPRRLRRVARRRSDRCASTRRDRNARTSASSSRAPRSRSRRAADGSRAARARRSGPA